MFTQQDLDEAVAKGALSPDAADGFRAHLAARSELTGADEEHFRLLTGFNDIFVSIAAVILLFSVGFIGMQLVPPSDHGIPSPISGILVAATAWGLALFFTARRRMALPSILLLLAFVGGLFSAGAFGGALIAKSAGLENSRSAMTTIIAVAAAIAAAGASFTGDASRFRSRSLQEQQRWPGSPSRSPHRHCRSTQATAASGCSA